VTITSIIVILLSYMLGCVSVGYYLVRWRTGQDLRQIGSGATGGRNASRVLGKSGAIITGLGDVLKGVIAMSIAMGFKLDAWALALVMIAVLAGHVWPVQLGFKGGKGLSAAFGAVLVYDYRIALLVALTAILLFGLTHRNELFFLFGIACTPIIAFFLGSPWEIVTGLTALICFILYAHRENIRESIKPYLTLKER
jgi:acyl phosphate:glycerol-3-phosphate acyltransferase